VTELCDVAGPPSDHLIANDVLKSTMSAEHPLLTAHQLAQAKEFRQSRCFALVSKALLRR
jgi:hypothetical protein